MKGLYVVNFQTIFKHKSLKRHGASHEENRFEHFDSCNWIVGGCGKDSVSPIPPTPTVVPKPNNLIIKADTALYNEKSKLTITTDAVLVIINGIEHAVSAGTYVDSIGPLKMDSTLKIQAININANGKRSEALAMDFTVKAFSLNSSKMQKLGIVVNSISRSCTPGNENSVSPDWESGIIDCSLYGFNANGNSYGFIGPCHSNPGTSISGTWKWANTTETKIEFSGFDVWDIEIFSNGFKRSRTKNGRYVEQVFSQK